MKSDIPKHTQGTPLSFGRAAALAGVSTSTLRTWEKAGLIFFDRNVRGHRTATERDLKRVRRIRALIREQKLNLESIRVLWSMIPCWKLKKCQPSIRATCAYFQEGFDPCWMYYHEMGGCEMDDCRRCDIYLQAIDRMDRLNQAYL